jgi:carbon storage regulator
MLVLSRKLNEAIVIGESVVVRVVDCKNGRVRLGIEAPPWVEIMREELHGEPRADKREERVAPKG